MSGSEEISQDRWKYETVLLDKHGDTAKLLEFSEDLEKLLALGRPEHDPEKHAVMIRQYPAWCTDPHSGHAENLFVWDCLQDKWQACTGAAVDLMQPRFSPPRKIYMCRDWTTQDTTYPSRYLVNLEECGGCPDLGQCKGPVEYAMVEIPEDLKKLMSSDPLENNCIPDIDLPLQQVELEAKPKPPVISTLEQAVQFLIDDCTNEDPEGVATWMELPEEEAVTRTHHLRGRGLRNELNLWQDSPLVRYMHTKYGISHADDISSIILMCAHRKMNNLPWDVEGQAKRYIDYWDKKGGQPLPPWERPCRG